MRAVTFVAAAVVLIAGLVKSEPCGPGSVNMTVGSPEDADKLSEALSCTGGGAFEVAWSGTVRITRSLVVGEGSFLNVTGTRSLLYPHRPPTLLPTIY